MNDAKATEWHGARMLADWLMAIAPIYELLDAGGATDASARRVLQAHLDARGQCY